MPVLLSNAAPGKRRADGKRHHLLEALMEGLWSGNTANGSRTGRVRLPHAFNGCRQLYTLKIDTIIAQIGERNMKTTGDKYLDQRFLDMKRRTRILGLIGLHWPFQIML